MRSAFTRGFPMQAPISNIFTKYMLFNHCIFWSYILILAPYTVATCVTIEGLTILIAVAWARWIKGP